MNDNTRCAIEHVACLAFVLAVIHELRKALLG